MLFIDELKRRNVFRVGIAYIVGAWLLIQLTDIVLDNIGAPAWVLQAVFVALAVGFFITLFLAWAFELTPDGIKKEEHVERTESITHTTGRKLDFIIIGILVVALGYFAFDKFTQSPAQSSIPIEIVETIKPVTKEKSIAVLPFVNMSDDASNEYFSDGISEEILNSLAKVKELKVAGRTSSFAFKGQNQDLRKIGEMLGVENILEGSVRKFGNQIRITAQLIQVEDGFHLWSESYDRELDNVFAIQDEIASAIMVELKATLLEEEVQLVKTVRTNSEAYDLYLLAKQRIYERTRLTLESAADLLDKAIAIDPEYAPAYAQRGIATLLLSITSYGDIPNDQALIQAKLYLDRALLLDENLAEGWAGLGLYYNGPPPVPAKAIPVLEKALAINPNLVNASNWLILSYWAVNRGVESMALLDDIAKRDPLYKPAIGNRVFQLALMGKGAEAREFLTSLEPFLPGDPQIDGSRAWIDFETGEVAAGLYRMKSAFQIQPTDRTYKAGVNQGNYLAHEYDQVFDDYWSGYHISALFNLGRNEEALIAARRLAINGTVAPLFAFLNASDQSELLIDYFEERWSSLEAFQTDLSAQMWGYREMADIALAYRRADNQSQFRAAMTILNNTNQQTILQGMQGNDLSMVLAAYHAMAGDPEQAMIWLAKAIDGGLIASNKISKEYPYFKELDGNPEYEAIQARMIDHLNRERALLDLEPASI